MISILFKYCDIVLRVCYCSFEVNPCDIFSRFNIIYKSIAVDIVFISEIFKRIIKCIELLEICASSFLD